MDNFFLQGFADELVKTSAAETMLGQKVKNAVGKIAKRSAGIRSQTKGGSGLKGVVKAAEDDTGAAGDVLRTIMEEAQARINDEGNEQGYNDQLGSGANDDSYGAGTGTTTIHGNKQPLPPRPPPPQAPRQAPPRRVVGTGENTAPIVRKAPAPPAPARKLPVDLP